MQLTLGDELELAPSRCVRNAFGGVGEKVRGTWSFTTRSEKMRYRLPGVILGCGLATRENLVKAA